MKVRKILDIYRKKFHSRAFKKSRLWPKTKSPLKIRGEKVKLEEAYAKKFSRIIVRKSLLLVSN